MDMITKKIDKIYQNHRITIIGGCSFLGFLVFMMKNIPINIRLYCVIGMPLVGYFYYPRAAERAVKR